MREPSARIVEAQPKPLTVGEFNRIVKAQLEEEFAAVWIEGEIAGYKLSSLGHAYFDLKDDRENARVSCCLFKGTLARTNATLRDGERLLVRARASIYPARGQFQLIVDTALAAGAGAQAAALEALKRKLAAEGLFAPERKRALPRFPRAVGVVTARNSAAFADICRVMHRRWPARIVVADTLVQGADAPARIVAALLAIQRDREVDVVIIGRGGGAADDLAAFNDESVARAIVACRVPVIAAIGHEIDHTIADLAADVRASTPSNAAELAVPEHDAVAEEIAGHGARLRHAMRARVNSGRVALARFEKRLADPRRLTENVRQELDEGLRRMESALRRTTTVRTRALTDLRSRLDRAHPRVRLSGDRARLVTLRQRLTPGVRALLGERERTLSTLGALVSPALRRIVDARTWSLRTATARLDALSPLAILSRGYSVVLANGKALTRSDEVRAGGTIDVRLHRGALTATVLDVRAPDVSPPDVRAPDAALDARPGPRRRGTRS